jgi:hypothetical protein
VVRPMAAMAATAGLVSGLLAAPAPAAPGRAEVAVGACAGGTGTGDAGAVGIGQRFVLEVAPACGFDAGAAVTVTVNGVRVPGRTAGAGGSVLLDIAVASATRLSLGALVPVPAMCGVNMVAARGPSSPAPGGVAVENVTFTLDCPAGEPAAPAPAPTASGGPAAVAAMLVVMVAGALAVVVARRRAR